MIHALMASLEAADPQKAFLAPDCPGEPGKARYAMAAAGAYWNAACEPSAGVDAARPANKHYVVNREPLLQTAFVHLPAGTVKARGWLRDQLRVEADGLTSYLWSAFSCASADANPPYHQEGVVALALVLGDDPRLTALAKGYVDRRITLESKPALTFGNASIMRFLMEYQEATGDPRIVPWMRQWYRRAGTSVPNDGGWEYQGCHEHLIALYWLFNRTGDTDLLEHARGIVVRDNPPPEQWHGVGFTTLPGNMVPSIDSISEGFLRLPHLITTSHGVVTAWRIKYPALFYQQQPEERYRQAVTEGIRRLDNCFGQIAGRFAAHENFPSLPTGRDPSHGTELCCSMEYAYSMEHLFEVLGDPAAGDRIEALAYNTWPGQMTADMWCHQYDVQANQVAVSVAARGWDNSPWANVYGLLSHWTCCLANQHQGWPRLVENLWMATHDNGLLAAVYGPCEVAAKVGADGTRVTITEETEYPFDGKIRMTIRAERPLGFPLHMRVPFWAEGAMLRVCGQEYPVRAGTIFLLSRQWRPGDVVELDLPMHLRVEDRFNKAVAIQRGPLYFALRVGQDYRECPWDNPGQGAGKLSAKPVREKSGFPVFDWEIYPSTPWNYALVIDRRHPESSVTVARHPVGKIPFVGKGEPVIVKIPESDGPGIARAVFRAEVSEVLPHPAEGNLKHDGKPWPLTADGHEQWVGFQRTVWQQDEPIVLRTKARLLPEWKMLLGKNPASGQMVPAMAAPPPPSPRTSSEPEIQVELIPFGCTRLRIAEFPTIGNRELIAAGNPWANYRFAPDALREIDLASDTAWKFSIDGGAEQPVKVPAGGWNSDRQDPPIPTMTGVKDHVVYMRQIQIPAEAAGKVVKVLFGGCNYGAEVFVGDRKVAEHHAPMTPLEADLTAAVESGKVYTLRVKAYHRRHYHPKPDASPCDLPVGFDFPADSKQWCSWSGNTKFAYGITGHVRLAVYSSVHVADVFVRPSVKRDQLEARVWVRNATAEDKRVIVSASLTPWEGRDWRYPSLPAVEAAIPARSVTELTVGPVTWGLGPQSYWWPNIPFREDYKATLHWLDLAVHVDGKMCHNCRQRFGFVEHAEGPYYYTVNGVRYTSFGDSNSYGQVGEYDCWTETPCFQPPHDEWKGCPETWRRYQRIGFNSMRLSTSVPTRYMLETADEAGFMLNPEGGSWGNGLGRFDKERFGGQLQGMIRAVRNHPCVARYSLANESLPGQPERPDCQWRWLIDAAVEVDDTRPCVFEVNPGVGTGPVPGMKRGHAYRMQHYDPIIPAGGQLRGMGECAWATDGMEVLPQMAIKMRLNDWAHFAPWSWLNFWPNFLEGMSHERHPWKANNHVDRRDGVDGWGSLPVLLVQRALHPYLVVDQVLLDAEPKHRATSAHIQAASWRMSPRYRAGGTVSRSIEVFNGGLSGRVLELKWEARWDAPDGELLRAGRSGPVEIEPGFHVTQKVEFPLPTTIHHPRPLCLVLESLKDGKTVYREDRGHFQVLPASTAATSVRFVGLDEKTQGDWRGKYGGAGHEVIGVATSWAKGVHFDWSDAGTYTWAKQTDDRRALVGDGAARIAACRYSGELNLVADLTGDSRRLSLYCVDWDRQRSKQTFTVRGEDGTVLDRREIGKIQSGCYLTWEVQGCVRITVEHQGGPNAVVSGVFLD
jgi:hypothetical protein